MRKEKPSSLVQAIILATAVFNIFTAVLNLFTAGVRAAPAAAAVPPAAISQVVCPAPAAPQVIQYLNVPPPRTNEKEPSRPDGQ